MAVAILYFAWVRERIGTDAEQLEVPPEVKTVGALAAWLSRRSEGHREAFADLDRLRAAVDQQFAAMDAPIHGAREVAFFPPVTGG